MGVYSTLYITRETALRLIRDNIECADNDQLAEAVFSLLGEKTLHNFIVGEKSEEESEPMIYDTLCED